MALSPEEMRARLAQLLKEQARAQKQAPLSFSQERFWFLEQLNPGSAASNVAIAVRLSGPLDAEALRRSLQEVVQRHETLRTTFASRDGRPVQVIAPSLELLLPIVDLQEIPEADRARVARERATTESQRPYDLTRGPLLRVMLLRQTPREHLLLVLMHHIVSDGWSMGVLVREIAALYQAFVEGKPPPLPALPLQYSDFVTWQRDWLRGEVLEAQLRYWRAQLDPDAILELPSDKPRPTVLSPRGAREVITLPPALGQALKSLDQREGKTLFVKLLTAFKILLYRYTGQEDLVVGTAIAGRVRRELEGLIGLFINTLALRTDLSGQPSFRALMARVHETTQEAYAHQELPFEKLVEIHKPKRDLNHAPLCQVMFLLQNAPMPAVELPGLVMDAQPVDTGTAKLDLLMTVTDYPQGMRVTAEYSTDLFEATTVRRLLGHFERLLAGIVENPDQHITDLPLLTDAERRTLLVDWNDTRADYPREATVHEVFEAQAARTPDAIAVEFEGSRLTYRQLDARANQLAHYLRRLGISAGTPVALGLERSLELVIALLAILKSGGAYVPLDAAYPRDRLELMLADIQAPVLLTDHRLVERLPRGSARVVLLDEERAAIARESDAPPRAGVPADGLAYVMFTSGSTGRPKGVCIPHRGILRLVLGTRFAHFGPREVFLQLAPVSFDASTFELWGSLLHGAKLVVHPPQAPTFEELGRTLEQHGVTTLWLTAALFEQMMASQPGALSGVRQLLAGGDVLPVARVKERLARGGLLVNGYGPTESTTFACCYVLTGLEQVGSSVSIGRPIANTRAFVLDARMQPVPIGVPGELYLGGDGLSWGYLRRPALTAEKFLPNPFASTPGERLYRTGDRVRFLPDGTLDFLGRLDTQVKLRGFRIEPGEIEAALVEHPSVREATVLAREDVPGDKRLVAYVVGKSGLVDPEALRNHLRQKLPEYMVPSAVVPLDALPLTPNGKVDRKALPAPTLGASAEEFVAPTTPTEATLAALWRELLGVERVGLRDDFFSLGGHSLLATQLISRVRSAFQVELPLRAVFENATVAALSRAIDGAQQGRVGTVATTQAGSRSGELPLSFSQQRLWFLDQLEPGGALYNVPVAVQLRGPLDVSALARGLEEVVQRHEALRTTFAVRDGRPHQIIGAPFPLPLEPVDLTTLPPDSRPLRARELARGEALRPFDLAKGPLVRAALLRLALDEHVLIVTMHHAVSDGWSVGVLLRELAALYQAFRQGQPSPLPPLPVQYADYVLWQRAHLEGGVLAEQLRYWKQQLSGPLPTLALPTDRSRPPVQTYRGGHHQFVLSPALAKTLQATSRQEGVTLFMTLLAAFQTLLHRYSGQDDIIVGTPIAGRTRAEHEGLIGFFVNTLALRIRLDGNPSFRALLARVREATLGAYAHQDVPFEKLVEELQPERDLSRSPLFQAMFALQNMPIPELSLGGVTLTPLNVDPGVSKFDLSLYAWETPEGLRASLEYNADLFDASTIARMADHLQRLLEYAASNPDLSITALPLLTDAERRQLLVTWNQTGDVDDVRCLHQLFEAQVERTPDAPALIDGTRTLSYAELNQRANQLAHALRQLGVTAESPVGICAKRSWEMVVGLFGILKAGGTYVPLDPAYPQDRLALVMDDAQVHVLVTQDALVSRLPAHSARVLRLDADWDSIRQASAENPTPVTTRDNVAYLIYTSGSTGRPKGVAIQHRNAVSLLLWAQRVFSPDLLAGTLAATSINFDLSVFELFLPLSLGASVILADNVLELPNLPAAERVTLVNTVPSAMTGLLRSASLPSGVRAVNLAGEPLPTALMQQLYEFPGVERVYDLYGPSETTTYSTFALRDPKGPATVGRPIAGTQVYLLDSRLESVPVGVPGELYIGGAGVARGYLRRPDLTAEKFVPDPFSGVPGARLYRTGDLARYLPDGNLEYLGRRDFQVKIRGFRIELGEIESVLTQHPAIREAVVHAREDKPGEKRLVAYVTAKQDAPDAADLRAFLKSRLPEYMVPAAWVFLDQLPLTRNGKVDRKALPAPDSAAPTDHYVAPRTPTEERLAAIWAEVLNRPRVGAEDNFFELGGHSLLATQVTSRLRTAFNVELPIRAVFEDPTVAALARRIDAAVHEKQPPQAPLTQSPQHSGAHPLSFAQQRLWFLDQLEPGSPLYNIPFAVRLTGDLDVSALERSLQEIVRRHDALRTTFQAKDGKPVQVISPEIAVPIQRIALSQLPPERRETRARQHLREEALRPFDLARGPLVRGVLLDLGAREAVLFVTMHHIVSDGWSMGIFVREMATLYDAFHQGKPSPLPAPSLRYADYAAWQRQRLQGEVLDEQLRYWKQQLSDRLPVLELPTDRPRPPVQTYRGSKHTFLMPATLAEALNGVSRQQGATLFMTLLAAFQTLLHRYSGQDDIIVGTPIAGRTRTELEGLIGFFVNTLALRTRLGGNPTFQELLTRVRETTLGAYAHQELPFERLVEEIHPERDLSRAPVFQVMFALMNMPRPRLELDGVTLELLELEGDVSKFDLLLTMQESPQGLRAVLQYNTDLFDAATIERMAGHFRRLLEGIAAQPGQRIAALPLLTDAERQQLLVTWNQTGDVYDARCLHQLFEAQVERTPDAPALIDGTRTLSYAELNQRANRLAHTLRQLGVTAESPVGICAKRSWEMVVGLFGILKAGGIYVPLDPAYPQDRLALVMDDAQVHVLVTQDALVSRLPAHSARVLRLDADWESIRQASAENPIPGTSRDNVAYLIYTSGSTGRPKGVAIQHRNAVSLLLWAQRVFSPDLLAGTLAATSINFDLSVFELFLPLSLGASVILADNVLELPNLPAAERVTLVNTVPSAMTGLLRSASLPSHVRAVNLAGEPLPTALMQQLYKLPGIERVYDLYGPSETTTYSTFALRDPKGPATVGRPIAGTQVYLLDTRLEPVPVGVPGELYIGGAGVTRGYLRRPDLTAEKFVPDPFGGVPGARLYRTGDLARFLPDGNLEYLGRRDFQVKIRGFRIELGEIESVLTQHPAVRQAVVHAREDRPGEKRLVAYVTAKQDAPDTADLRAFLKSRLPEYMVPTAWVFLGQLPLTPNGKVDRKALPAPDLAAPADRYVAPRTPTEERLAAIWAEVLGQPRIGAEDHFFELGGHSLLATQVASRVRATFEIELPVRSLFENPTLSALGRAVDVASQGPRLAQAPPLRPVPRTGPLPLSFAQQRLWFLDQLEPGSAFYNIPVAVRLTGALDMSALARSLEEIVRRHESLRTTFTTVAGEPAQVIAQDVSLPLDPIDLYALPPEVREARALELAREESLRPFDLANGPLLRAALLRIAPKDHVLLVTMHHVVSDGWSLGVFVRELAALYPALLEGRASPLPPLFIQYADYAAWQREWLRGSVLDEQVRYWKQQLSGRLPVLELPTDRPRPPVQTYRGAKHMFLLPPALTDELRAMGLAQGSTLFMVLLAGFQALLHRYSGQEDIIVGTPIAGRTRTELEELIGFFVNTLALRTNLGGDPSFRTLIERVREATLGAYAHQHLPFEKLVEELRPERDLSRTPIFQALFALQNLPVPELSLAELTISPVDSGSTIAKFDLSLYLTETQQGLRGSLEYNTDLFDAATIARMAGHFEQLLKGAVARPDQRVAALPLLTDAECQQLLVTWNQTGDVDDARCLHQLFEAQVERTPDAPALIDGTRTLCYAELNQRANRLAHTLRQLGVTTESPVGICAKRSWEMVVGLFGILKAGGTYVPLDPAYPPERLALVMEDAQVHVLLTQDALVSRLPAHSARMLRLDADWESIRQASAENPTPVTTRENVAYLIYTSGSTGRPKGVAIQHRNAVSLLLWAQRVFSPDLLAGTLAATSINFDISVFELFLPLSLGASVILADNVLELPNLPAAERVTLVNTVPSAMTGLLRSASLPSHVRAVNLAGEPLPTALMQQLYRLPGIERVYDLYGPSETTTYSTFALREPNGPATVGRPIAGTQVYLLDSRLEPVPVGVPGELYIGGAGVARGYLRRPDLTAERFIPDPFSGVPGARLYRTGDLARYFPDGNLEYLGRRDFQVKVRGFRIELGEIESVLAQHPAVRQAVVHAREDKPGEKRLVAYVTAKQDAPDAADLRAFLKSRLPEYMVPAAWVFLGQLPLTPNGKVDRKALPAPEANTADTRQAPVAPRDELERKLARIWEELLDVRPVGVRHDFFELGGHSLLAARLVTRIQQELGRRLSLVALFQHPTVEALATALREPQQDAPPPSSLVRMQDGAPGVRPIFFVHGAGGGVLGYAELARQLGPTRPFYALRPPDAEAAQVHPSSVEELARHYVAQIRAEQPEGPYLLGGWSFGGLVALEMAQQLQAAGQPVALLALVDTHAPTDAAPHEPDALALLAAFGLNLGIDWRQLPLDLEHLEQLPAQARLGYVLEQARKSAAGAPHLAPEQAEHLFALYARDMAAMRRYVLRPYTGPAVLFKSGIQLSAPAADLGWGAWLTGPFSVCEVPGDHHTMLRAPHVATLASNLTERLDLQDTKDAA